MGKVSCQAIAYHLDIVWFEPIISVKRPEDPPGRFHVAGRQLYIHGGFGPTKVQHEGTRDEFTESDFLPVFLDQTLYHRPNPWSNRFRIDVRRQLNFCRKQIGQGVEQGPHGVFHRSAVRFVVLKLSCSKLT